MEEIKNKMYNFETTPPEGVWNKIVLNLDNKEAKVIHLATRRSKSFIYMAAASVVALLFCLIFFINRFSTAENHEYVTLTSNENTPQDSTNITNVIMTVPIEEKPINNNIENSKSLTQSKLQKDFSNQKQKKGELQKIDKTDNNLIAANSPSRYITIQGPQGQSIKVSSKMATLIDSSETKVSSKPIWDKKIDEWREIMKVNTLAQTPGNFLDIVELTKALKDK
jgi:hypothetical protein